MYVQPSSEAKPAPDGAEEEEQGVEEDEGARLLSQQDSAVDSPRDHSPT